MNRISKKFPDAQYYFAAATIAIPATYLAVVTALNIKDTVVELTNN